MANRGPSAMDDLERGGQAPEHGNKEGQPGTTDKADESEKTSSPPDDQDKSAARIISRIMHNPLHARDGRYEKFKSDKMRNHPPGNPQMAFFISSYPTTKIYRKFGYLRHRLLQYKQDELTSLEKRLLALDRKDEAEDESERLWRIRQDDTNEEDYKERRDLIAEIDEKLEEYDALLARERDVDSFRKPSKASHRGLFNYIWDEKPVVNQDFDFILHEDDLITVTKDREHGLLDETVQSILDWLPSTILRPFASAKEQERMDYDRYDSGSHREIIPTKTFENLIKSCIALIATALLLIPVVLLYVVRTSKTGYLMIVIATVLAFALVMVGVTSARRYEIFAATAAYAAVLVVFLGNAQGFQQLK